MAFSLGSTSTLIDYLVPPQQSRSINLLKDGLLVIGFSLFLALCAQLSFHLSFTPVPITLQTLGVLLTGAALGSRRAGLAMLSYLAEGALGLPVFAGGTGDLSTLSGLPVAISGHTHLQHLSPDSSANVTWTSGFLHQP